MSKIFRTSKSQLRKAKISRISREESGSLEGYMSIVSKEYDSFKELRVRACESGNR